MSIRIKGTTNLQEVDATGAANVNLPTTETNAGYSIMSSRVDDGTITGTPYNKSLEVDEQYRATTSTDQLLFSENFPGTTFNTSQWNNPTTTATATIVNGFATLNAGLSIASGAVAQLSSRKYIPTYKQNTIKTEMEMQFTQLPQTNNVCEWGLFLASGTTAPTDGHFFRLTATGSFVCVASYGGTETLSTTFNFSTLVGTNVTNTFLIYSGATSIYYWLNNVLLCEIENPVGSASSSSAMALPLSFRIYNSGATSLAQVMKIGSVSSLLTGISQSKPWGHILAGNGQHSSQFQTGNAMGQTAISPNAALTVSAVPTNTTAAAGQVGLGGETLITTTMAINTPVIVFSFLNPLGTATLPGKDLFISGVTIQSTTVTAHTAVAPILTWGIAYGHTALSLATTESATTKAPRKIMLGCETLVLTVGTNNLRFQDDFTVSPIVVKPGEYFQIVCTNRSATAATAGGLLVIANATGYWE